MDDPTPAPPSVQTPIDVPKTATNKVVFSIVRYALTAIGTYIVAKGWFGQEVVDYTIGAALMVVPGVVGGWLSKLNNDKLKFLQGFVLDSVARLK